MRRAWIVDLLCSLDESGRFSGRVLHGNNLVILPMHDQSRNIELLQVFGEISFRERLDGLIRVLEAALHAPKPELIQRSLRHVGAWSVCTIKRYCQIFIKL